MPPTAKRSASSAGLLPKGYVRLSFIDFCCARQDVLTARREGKPRDEYAPHVAWKKKKARCTRARRD